MWCFVHLYVCFLGNEVSLYKVLFVVAFRLGTYFSILSVDQLIKDHCEAGFFYSAARDRGSFQLRLQAIENEFNKACY